MPIDEEFLKILCCPNCRGDLEFRKKETKEELKCTSCKRVYPVEDDIPVLLPDAGYVET